MSGGMSGGMSAGSGSMNAGAHENALFQPYSTLDEPVLETIMRDVRAVASKLKVVMLPLDRTVSLCAQNKNCYCFAVFSLFLCVFIYLLQPHFVGGYAGVSQSEQNGDMGSAEAQEMSENDRKVIQELKDWDLW